MRACSWMLSLAPYCAVTGTPSICCNGAAATKELLQDLWSPWRKSWRKSLQASFNISRSHLYTCLFYFFQKHRWRAWWYQFEIFIYGAWCIVFRCNLGAVFWWSFHEFTCFYFCPAFVFPNFGRPWNSSPFSIPEWAVLARLHTGVLSFNEVSRSVIPS